MLIDNNNSKNKKKENHRSPGVFGLLELVVAHNALVLFLDHARPVDLRHTIAATATSTATIHSSTHRSPDCSLLTTHVLYPICLFSTNTYKNNKHICV